jgi:hypothetical protein
MEHGSLKRGLLIIPKKEVHGNTIYDATSTLSVTVYFDATRTDIIETTKLPEQGMFY